MFVGNGLFELDCRFCSQFCRLKARSSELFESGRSYSLRTMEVSDKQRFRIETMKYKDLIATDHTSEDKESLPDNGIFVWQKLQKHCLHGWDILMCPRQSRPVTLISTTWFGRRLSPAAFPFSEHHFHSKRTSTLRMQRSTSRPASRAASVISSMQSKTTELSTAMSNLDLVGVLGDSPDHSRGLAEDTSVSHTKPTKSSVYIQSVKGSSKYISPASNISYLEHKNTTKTASGTSLGPPSILQSPRNIINGTGVGSSRVLSPLSGNLKVKWGPETLGPRTGQVSAYNSSNNWRQNMRPAFSAEEDSAHQPRPTRVRRQIYPGHWYKPGKIIRALLHVSMVLKNCPFHSADRANSEMCRRKTSGEPTRMRLSRIGVRALHRVRTVTSTRKNGK